MRQTATVRPPHTSCPGAHTPASSAHCRAGTTKRLAMRCRACAGRRSEPLNAWVTPRCRQKATRTLTQARPHHLAHDTPHDRPAFFESMAVVCNRQEMPPPRRRVPSRSAGAQPGVYANWLTSMPFAYRCRDVLRPSVPPRDVVRRWHSTCTESTGEPGFSEARPTLPSLVLRRQEDHTSAAVCAGEGDVRRRTCRV